MLRPMFAVLAVLCLAAPFAKAAGVATGPAILDPSGLIRPALLNQAVAAWRQRPQARRDALVVVDFQLPSSAPRFFVVDMTTGRVEAYHITHGKGSDPDHDGLADAFSDTPDSLMSSLGAYLTESRYVGQHGLSLRLEGLDPTNAHAMARAIVLHGADYADEAYIRRHGRAGRSFGCFALAPALVETMIARLEGGVLIYAGR